MEIDPVCHMEVKPSPKTPQSKYKGKAYYFCAQGCKVKFDANPGKYA